MTRLEWKIDFQYSQSTTSVTRQYKSNDEEGLTLEAARPGIYFMFNLTSNSSASLVSVMTVTIHNASAVALINNATVNCGNGTKEVYQRVLHLIDGNYSIIV